MGTCCGVYQEPFFNRDSLISLAMWYFVQIDRNVGLDYSEADASYFFSFSTEVRQFKMWFCWLYSQNKSMMYGLRNFKMLPRAWAFFLGCWTSRCNNLYPLPYLFHPSFIFFGFRLSQINELLVFINPCVFMWFRSFFGMYWFVWYDVGIFVLRWPMIAKVKYVVSKLFSYSMVICLGAVVSWCCCNCKAKQLIICLVFVW